MNDDQPVKASNFNLKMDYPSADVGQALKKKRLSIADSRLGIKDQLNNENPISREQDDTDTSAG
jgi:hypothetical protein